MAPLRRGRLPAGMGVGPERHVARSTSDWSLMLGANLAEGRRCLMLGGTWAVVYSSLVYYVHMIKRTTIEIDEQLLARAKRALGCPTNRATIEEALRRAAELAENEHEERVARLREYLTSLAAHVDLEVLKSDERWR